MSERAGGLFGLSSDLKQQLASRLTARRGGQAARPQTDAAQADRADTPALGDAKVLDDLRIIRDGRRACSKIADPYFRVP